MTPRPETPSDETPEAGPPPGRKVSRLKLAVAAIVFLLVASIPLWAPLLLRRMNFFHVRRLEIVGTRYIASSEIVARASVDTMRSVWDPMTPIERRVKTHPGVQTVSIRRKLPSTLVITVTEYQPVALVPGPQGFRVFDERGVALPIDLTRVAVDAPVLAKADTALLRLLSELRAQLPGVYKRVSELRRLGPNELLFQLDDAPVRTLAAVTVQDLNQIQSVEEDLQKRGVTLAELDLRYTGQIIARLQ
jgi:cell division protein FtsQ